MKSEESESDECIVGPYLRQMKAPECKMRAYCKWTKSYETMGKAHERKQSDFVIGPSLKWT